LGIASDHDDIEGPRERNHRPVTSAREADLVDLDALLTAQYLVQGSFFLNFGLQKRRIATRPIGG
jgi:hypothetical protein